MLPKTKISLLVAIVVLFSFKSFAQLNHFRLLIGEDEPTVTNYLDSLDGLKNNPYVKIEKSVTSYGDLIYTNGFAMSDEEYYTCLDVYIIFHRFNGKELCVKEVVIGRNQFVEPNLSFMKDNFKHISDKKWEAPFRGNIFFKVTANFESKEVDNYAITYDLIELPLK